MKSRHHFFLNPYSTTGFTRCPKCGSKMRFKKIPLVIHIEPKNLVNLGKTCKYCLNCDLVIVKQKELESLLAAIFEKQNPDVIGNKYFVIGTLEYKIWRQNLEKKMRVDELFELMRPFKDFWEFSPRGWYLNKEE